MAGEEAWAVRVLGAFLGGRSSFAPLQVGVTSCSSRALAFVGAGLIEASSPRPARVPCALIHVLAPMYGVAGVTSSTQALRRVRGGAISIDATHEPLTRALALSAIFSVGEEGRWADALAGLHALLIRPAVIVPGALGLVCRADPGVGITRGADGAHTAERSNLVFT